MLKKRRLLRLPLRIVLVGLLFLIGAMAMQAPATRAEGDTELKPSDEAPATPQPPADEKTKRRLETLKRQHEELQFQKRTKEPFTSDRSLRHQLRRNEAQQGWQKGEQRRQEYEQQRQQLESGTR